LGEKATALADAESGSDQLGLDLAAGADELAGMTAEANADTLETELTRAAEQDDQLGSVDGELGEALS
jgi:hypothetical protein